MTAPTPATPSTHGGPRRHSGRKPTGKKTHTLTITLPPGALPRIRDAARSAKITPNKYIVRATLAHLPAP